MEPRFLKRSIAGSERQYLRMRLVSLTIAQCTFALITLALGWSVARRGFAGEPIAGWMPFVHGVTAILLALHATAVVGFWMGRIWGCHAAFLACSPYLLALGGAAIGAFFSGQIELGSPGTLLALAVPLIGAWMVGAHILWYESAETRDEVERWGRRRAGSAATA